MLEIIEIKARAYKKDLCNVFRDWLFIRTNSLQEYYKVLSCIPQLKIHDILTIMPNVISRQEAKNVLGDLLLDISSNSGYLFLKFKTIDNFNTSEDILKNYVESEYND